jgi:hypothetical protein
MDKTTLNLLSHYLCSNCFSYRTNILSLPCGHISLCTNCKYLKRCPQCNVNILTSIQVFYDNINQHNIEKTTTLNLLSYYLCSNCFSYRANILSLPCGHISLCMNCKHLKRCPYCNINILTHILVFHG